METQRRRTRRQFSDEFKLEAVQLIEKIGLSGASRELDVGVTTLRSWRIKLSRGDDHKGEKTYADLEKENRRLLKELGYLKEINKVLKKSTAIFCNDHMENLK